MSTRQNREHVPLIRSTSYEIFSRCFRYPTEDFWEYARKNLVNDLREALKKHPYYEHIEKSYRLFELALLQQLTRSCLEDLQIEHTGLFIYPRSNFFCSCYESAYRDVGRCLMGKSAMSVNRFYRKFQLRISRQFRDLPDHIAAELEFMHFLSYNEHRYLINRSHINIFRCIQTELRFLEDHLQQWVPRFAACLKENLSGGVFVTLAQLVRNFLFAEVDYLKAKYAQKKASSSDANTISMVLDTSTVSVFEKEDRLSLGPEVQWVYTTAPERYWYSPIKVKVIDGKAVQIVIRDDDVPLFDGKTDVRAFASLAKLYAVDKLKFPLKRTGQRGEGKFRRISWDEALSEIATVLGKYHAEGNAKYVAFLRTHPPMEFLFNHFTHHYGSPNDIHTSTTSCFADAMVADILTGDNELGASKDDYLNSNYVLYIGHTLLNGVMEIPRAVRFAEGLRKGSKFVFVDPRLNEGSYVYGAEWVPIKPGTDSAFILSLIYVLIRDELFDREFLLRHTNAPILIRSDGYPLKDKNGKYLEWDISADDAKPLNEALQPALEGDFEVKVGNCQEICKTAFQRLMERVAAYPPEEASSITTIPKEKIEEIGRDLGLSKPHISIYSGRAVSAQYSNSLQRCRARNVLMCLLGIFDKPGGKYYGPYGETGIELNKPADFRIPLKVHPMTQDRVDFDPAVHASINTAVSGAYPLGVIQNVLKAINTHKPYPIKALFIIGSDVLASQSFEWREAFKKVDFIVKSHVWPDDDTDYADIVLPEASYLERDEGFAEVTVHDPENKNKEFSFLTVVQRVVEPQIEERNWFEYTKELAQRMGFGKYFDFSLEEYWNFLLSPMGIDMDYLRKHGIYSPTPVVTREIEFGGKEHWNTATGRLSIYSVEMVDLWHENHQEPRFDPVPCYHQITVEPKADNEFYLLSGKVSYFKCNFYRDNALLLEEYLEGELGNTLLWINAEKAATLGIDDRDWVWVESKATGMKERIRVKATEGIHPSAVWHPYGYGHKAKLMDKRSRARDGINVQDFIPQHNVPWTAGEAHCEAVVKVYKARQGVK